MNVGQSLEMQVSQPAGDSLQPPNAVCVCAGHEYYEVASGNDMVVRNMVWHHSGIKLGIGE